MDDEGWEKRMAERARLRRVARGEIDHRDDEYWFDRKANLTKELADNIAAQRAENPERFSATPPPRGEDDCPRCVEWKIENRGIGRYAWWLVCDYFNCTCPCHPPYEHRILIG